MKTKTPTKPIPLRIDAVTRNRIFKAAKRLGTSRSAIVRMALLIQLGQIESGVINLSQN